MVVKAFTQTDTAASFGAVQSCASHAVASGPSAKAASVGGTAGVTPVVVTINRDTASPRSGTMVQAAPGLALWPAGTWTVRLNVTVANANLTISRCYICRRTSGDVSVSTVGSNTAVATSLSTTGVKSISVTGSATTGSTSDVVYIVLVYSNSATSSQMFTYLPNQDVDMPLDIVLTPSPVAFSSASEDPSNELEQFPDPVDFVGAVVAPALDAGEVVVAPSPVAFGVAAVAIGTGLTSVSPSYVRTRIGIRAPTVSLILPYEFAAIGTPGGESGRAIFESAMYLCRIVRIARRDGVTVRYTDHDRPVPFHEGFTEYEYTPLGAPDPAARRMTNALETETDSLRGFVGTAVQNALTSEDAFEGRWDRAEVNVYVVNWRNPWLEPLDHRRYWMHDVTFSGEEWSCQLRGIIDQIDVLTGRVMTKRCDAKVGDDRCGVNLNVPEFSVTGATVLAISGLSGGDNPRLKFKSNITGFESGWFRYGVLRWVSGENAIYGLNEHDVRIHTDSGTGATIQLWLETPRDIAVNDMFDITAGCDHSLHRHCIKKFGNVENFRGFPYLPGWRKLIRQPDGQNF